ncbi:WXG100 family type VII secretion target [Actinokineospora guangxiensis]|uniref:WXG100 family type VII secretion target n=1 Tax=Actinokineospora guangxiensis TaxID=1490288 RepID=A0ABW0EY78_9PSEU
MPYPYPVPPPQEPTSLAEPVDWMAWPHAELYRMVHSGGDTAQAERTAQQWADVAQELHDIVDRLGKAVSASEAGWQGEAAAKAREGMRTVLAWAVETVLRAEQVRHAIHAEADHLEWARAAMPEPVPQWHGGECAVVPEPPGRGPEGGGRPGGREWIGGADAGRPQWAAGGDSGVAHWHGGKDAGLAQWHGGPDSGRPRFHGQQVAAPVVSVPPRQQADAAHREAAEVMARFQHGSSQVDGSIPAFAAPVSPVIVYGGPETTTPSGGVDGPGGSGGSSATTGLPGGNAANGVLGTTNTPAGPGTRDEPAPRPVSGQEAARTTPAEQTRPQAQPAAGGRSGGGAMGGMGAGSGMRPEEDHEHRTPAYLQEDSDVFGAHTPVAPPVLGA